MLVILHPHCGENARFVGTGIDADPVGTLLDLKRHRMAMDDQKPVFIPSIKKTKLMAYGAIDGGAKKAAPSRIAKVPNEIVELLPAWNGGLVVVETFLDHLLTLVLDVPHH